MDHAEAHELLADLALEPGRLGALDTDASGETAALRAHVAGCPVCATDVEAWRRTWTAFGDARGEAADLEPLRPTALMRARAIAAVAADPAAPAQVTPSGPAAVGESLPPVALVLPRRPPGFRGLPWIAAAAALAIAIGAGSLAWARTTEMERARSDASNLATLATTVGQVLADPVHWITPLDTADGAPAGTLAWSRTQIVVMSAALPPPGPGEVYRCWVERGGTRTPVGAMEFTAGTGYWVGSTAGWGDLLSPGARFGVSLAPAGGGGEAPVLVGQL